MKDHVIKLIKELDSKYNCKVKYIQCDNAGESISLKKAGKHEGEVVFFNTHHQTPYQTEKGRGSLQLCTMELELCLMVENFISKSTFGRSSRKCSSTTKHSGVSARIYESISQILGGQVIWIQFKYLVKSLQLVLIKVLLERKRNSFVLSAKI